MAALALQAWIESAAPQTATEQHPEEPLGIALHVKPVSSPELLMRGERDGGVTEEEETEQQDPGERLDGEQRCLCNLCVSAESELPASSLGLDALAQALQPITLTE